MEYLIGCILLFPVLLAPAVYFLGRNSTRRLNVLTIASCALELVLAALLMFAAASGIRQTAVFACLCGLGLSFEISGFRALYALMTSFAWFVSAVFTADYMQHGENRARYAFFLLLTLSGTLGVFLSSDLYTTFVFFEIMSFASYAWVAHEETEDARSAASTYLAVAVIGGLTALMGIWLIRDLAGTLVIRELSEKLQYARMQAMASANSFAYDRFRARLLAAAVCLFIGFGAKAGMFPIHIWLPKAHAAAPATASSLLSGILTKAGVFGIIVIACEIMPGEHAWGMAMLWVGMLTMAVGGILALFDNNIKRTLACSSVSQIGFILTGCAVLTLEPTSELAAGGVVLHMLNHSICKLILFTAAGIAYKNTHTLDLEKLRGWGRGKPLFFASFLLGAWGITGLPGGSGYVSKTLLHEALLEAGSGGLFTAFEWIFLFSGGLTIAYMTKLFVVLFVEKPEQPDSAGSCMTRSTAAVLLASALPVPLLGLIPDLTANALARFSMPFFRLDGFEGAEYFAWENLKGAVISVSIGAAVYFLLIRTLAMRKKNGKRRYVNARPAWLDLERYGFRPLLHLLVLIFGTVAGLLDRTMELTAALLTKLGSAAAAVLDRCMEFIVRILIKIGGVAARAADSLTDALLALLRVTCYRDLVRRPPPAFGNRMTYTVGTALDRFANAYAAVRHVPRRGKSYVYRLSKFHEIRVGENQLISRSMGYAMMMTCIGIFLTLLYIFSRLLIFK